MKELNKFDKRLFKEKSYGSVMSDVLACRLLKSENLSNCHEELIKATTTADLQHNLMKDQLKRLSVMPQARYQGRHRIPTKTEETFLAEEINQLLVQEHFIQNEAPHKQEHNPFRDSKNQYPYEHNHEAYYTRGNTIPKLPSKTKFTPKIPTIKHPLKNNILFQQTTASKGL